MELVFALVKACRLVRDAIDLLFSSQFVFYTFFRFNSGFYRNNRFSLKADYFIKSHSFCRKPSQFYSRLLYKSEPFSLFLSQLSRWFLSNFEFVLSGMYSIQISLDCSR